MKKFTGYKWWEHKNPTYRESSFRKGIQETIELKGQYDYFIKRENGRNTN